MKKNCALIYRAGFGLLEILIALTLVVVFVSYAMITLSQQKTSIVQYDYLGELNDLAHYLRVLTDCGQTFTAAQKTACVGQTAASNHYLDIKKSDGTVFVEVGQGSTVGNYNLRAKCIDEQGFYSVIFEQRRMMGGTEMPSPITKQLEGWLPLAAGIPLACS